MYMKNNRVCDLCQVADEEDSGADAERYPAPLHSGEKWVKEDQVRGPVLTRSKCRYHHTLCSDLSGESCLL